MGNGSMFEEPDFGRVQSGDEGYEEEIDDVDDEIDVDDELDEDDIGDDIASVAVDDVVEAVLDDDAEAPEDADDVLEDELDEDLDEIDEQIREEDDEDEELEEATVNRVYGATARAVLEHVTRALVDDPESVVVEVSEGRSGLRFSVHVAQGDMGRLIRRKGRTAHAIRTLVRAAAASDGTDASVDIVD
jgi:uncharacterized protein